MAPIRIVVFVAALLIGVGVVYRFVQFWIGFAQGINETGKDARGFAVERRGEEEQFREVHESQQSSHRRT